MQPRRDSMSGAWDAVTYDRVADPQARWGAAVLDRLPLRGDERVLDAGCGSGRVTEQLAERLPRGHVVALDASADMLVEARRRLGRFGERVAYVEADLSRALPADVGPVDAVLSTATFHWIDDHAALFRNLAAVMRPGAALVAQCGGAGNVATFARAVEAAGLGPFGRTFPTAEETADRLRAAGFTDIRTWLTQEPTDFEPGRPFTDFIEAVCLRVHLADLDAEARAAAVQRVADAMPAPHLDYVRLNMEAHRA